MEFLYTQREEHNILTTFGISNFLLKSFRYSTDNDTHTKKKHHHNDYEIHIVTRGKQLYALAGGEVLIVAGQVLLLPPKCEHQVLKCFEHTEKIVLFFRYDEEKNLLLLEKKQTHSLFALPQGIVEHIAFIKKETEALKTFSFALMENRLFEMIVTLFRANGNKETAVQSVKPEKPPVLLMAKQYTKDNIISAPTVKDVALYCHVSEKQLFRMFLKYEGITCHSYIQMQRLEAIKKLLLQKELSLKQISERLHFSSEYYFNVFFKKMYGMPPGAYRKML